MPLISKRPPRIQDLALGLATKLDPEDDVVLACHSLGGLIARRYLIREVQKKVPLKVKRLVALVMPIIGSNYANMARWISPFNVHLEQLMLNSDVTNQLSEDWLREGMEDKVQTSYVLGTLDRQAPIMPEWGPPRNAKIEIFNQLILTSSSRVTLMMKSLHGSRGFLLNS